MLAKVAVIRNKEVGLTIDDALLNACRNPSLGGLAVLQLVLLCPDHSVQVLNLRAHWDQAQLNRVVRKFANTPLYVFTLASVHKLLAHLLLLGLNLHWLSIVAYHLCWVDLALAEHLLHLGQLI